MEEKERRELLRRVALKIGTEESLIQLSEECGELVQAALKFRRAMQGTTPVKFSQAQENLIQEMADVSVCMKELMEELDYSFSTSGRTEQAVLNMEDFKTLRWCRRLKLEV